MQSSPLRKGKNMSKWDIFVTIGLEFCGRMEDKKWGVTDDGKFFLNIGEEIFVYDSLDDALLDWLETLEESNDFDWSSAIDYIKLNCHA